MRDRRSFAFASIVVGLCAVGACGFEHGEISDVDAPTSTITVEFSDPVTQTDEMEGMVRVAVELSGPAGEPVTVEYKVQSSSTATRPDDYTLTDGTLIFSPGQTLRHIDVAIATDALEEFDEEIQMMLANPVGATLGTEDLHIVMISADILARVSFADPAPSNAMENVTPMVELVLTLPVPTPVNVELGLGGTATGGGVDHGVTDSQLVVFPANVMSRMVPLNIVQDLLDENNETIDLSLKNPSLKLLIASTNNTRSHTIDDDDPMPTVAFMVATSPTPESANATLTVNLSAASGRTVTVPYSVTGGTAGAADATVVGAPGTLTFNAGETTKTIDITVTNDMTDEPDETIVVTLGAPTNATLGTNTAHTLTITDNDDPPTVAFIAATTPVNEVVAAVNLTVQLSTASAFDITVPFTIDAASTADNPDDYTLASTAALQIPAGMTTASIVVNVKADALDEANETVIANLGTPTNATLGTITTNTLTINDDDNPPVVAFTSMGSSPNEGNNNITLTVQLSDISGQDVTIPYTIDAASTASNPSDYTISPASPLTITAGSTSTTIVIAMKEDTVAESDETVIVTLGAPTNATLGSPSIYTLTIRNDDNDPDVSWDATESNGSELEGTAPPGPGTRTVTYKMVLSAASGLSVTAPILYSGTATKGTDYDGPASITFAPNVTTMDVTLTIQKDSDLEGTDTIIMTIDAANVTNAGTQAPTVRTHTLLNDDL